MSTDVHRAKGKLKFYHEAVVFAKKNVPKKDIKLYDIFVVIKNMTTCHHQHWE